MRYKSGISRIQDSFLPSCLDDYVGEEHICRVISAFTGNLDLVELGFKYAETKEVGCKPFALTYLAYSLRRVINIFSEKKRSLLKAITA